MISQFIGLPTISHHADKKQITMLTSSEAKWRCLWHLLVWSILLTLLITAGVQLTNHVAMMMLGVIAFVVLPIITALYSNTAGKHGAGLLRAAYVLCDPVLACISELPVMLIQDLPLLLQKQACLTQYSECQNQTMACLQNITNKNHDHNGSIAEDAETTDLERKLDTEFMIIEIAIVIPIIFSLLMGKRTRKMSYQTYLITFAYWFVAAIEAASILEVSRSASQYEHIICTVESVLSIVMIVANSYAIVTLCSYIVPTPTYAGEMSQRSIKKFDNVYGNLVAISGVFFAESPLFVAKIQMIGSSHGALFPGTFYIWLVKDVLFAGILVFFAVSHRLLKRQNNQIPCRTTLFDNKGVYFQPEKRDYYIQQNRMSYESSLDRAESQSSELEKISIDSKQSTEPENVPEKPAKKVKSVRFQFDLGKAGFSIVSAKEDPVT